MIPTGRASRQEPETGNGNGDGERKRRTETGTGDRNRRREPETENGDGNRRREPETGTGDGERRREPETGTGDGERRRRTETENGQDRVNPAKATLPDVRAPARPNRSARTCFTHRHKKAPTSGAYGDIRPTQNSPDVRSVRNVSKPTRKSSDRQGPRFTPDTKKPRRFPSGLFFRKRSAYSSLR